MGGEGEGQKAFRRCHEPRVMHFVLITVTVTHVGGHGLVRWWSQSGRGLDFVSLT